MKKKKAEETSAVTPFFRNITYASQRLGVSVYAVRVLIWNKRVRPVRKGAQFLFTEAMLTELAGKLESGEITFPRAPSRRKMAA
jgi:hypothetical protein